MQTSISIANARKYLIDLTDSIKKQQKNHTERLNLMAAYGRSLAADIVSPVSVPPHDNSAMDGFAFNADVLNNQQAVTLTVVGKALAGAAYKGVVGHGECVQITTGAVMPAGLDTVIPVELVQVVGDSVSFLSAAIKRGDNRRLKGEDLMQGSVALASGATLNSAALGLIASLGIGEVTVSPRLKVAYFSTGDEVLSVGEMPREGAIYDANRYTVFGMLTKLGCEVIDLGVVRDDPLLLQAAVDKASELSDVVITSGGVSVGEADHTKDMMRRLGQVDFWRIDMRPGRPMAVGTIPRQNRPPCLLFGLPGNPVAVMVTFLALVRPALQTLMGQAVQETLLLQAKSEHAIRKKAGRTEYQRGVVRYNDAGELAVSITGNQGSGVLSSMVQANGLIVLPHEGGNVATGDVVDVMMLDALI